jgi:hypothetical protein
MYPFVIYVFDLIFFCILLVLDVFCCIFFVYLGTCFYLFGFSSLYLLMCLDVYCFCAQCIWHLLIDFLFLHQKDWEIILN